MTDKANEFIFVWKIEKYSMLPQKNGYSLDSPQFKVNMCKDVEFQLALYPRGVMKKYEAACLLLHTWRVGNVNVKFYFVLQSTETTDAIVSKTFVYPTELYGMEYVFNINEIYAKTHIYLPGDVLTVRCHLLPAHEACVEEIAYKLDSKCSSLVKSLVCRSEVQVRRRSAIWSIRSRSNIEELAEKSFIVVLSNLCEFKLSLKFEEIATNEFVPLEIRQTHNFLENDDGVFVKCKITVISAKNEHQDFAESTYFFCPEKPDAWQFPPFIKVSNLTSENYLFLDDTLHLQCEFACSYGNDALYELEDVCTPLTLENRQNDAISDLSTSIEKCYSSGKLSDIQLQAGGKTFQAHRLVLGARSTVFSAMFENDMQERNSGVVNIVDVDPTTLKRMLEFLYGEVLNEDLSPEDVCKLYEAADKYNISSLKYRCWVSLTSSLSVASVCDVLVLADAHQDSFLLNAVYNFIGRHAGETFHSSNWKMLMDDNLKLASAVMHKLLTEKKLL